MRRFAKTLAPSLLAVYASIALLGQGLHFLTPDDHHHHAPTPASAASAHHEHHAYCHHQEHTPPGHNETADLVAGEHDCDVCDFLAQAKSPTPQIAAPPNLHTVVTDLQVHRPTFYLPLISGLHAARGPPQLLA